MLEETIPKILEYGFLGTFCIILLLKGIPALNELAKTILTLAEIISRLNEKVIRFETQLDKLENRFDSGFKEIRDILERRLKQ